ncbi:MAG: hypothetical protein M3Q06_03415, partial [Bacteroidota bacterium]|nr:hypothetical protein [Bacteroidota bacterium]
KYFNVYGQEAAAPTAKAVDASVTPQNILQKAIDAYGGAAAIAGIKDITLNGTASVQGMNINVTQKHVVPTAYTQEIGVQGTVLQKKMLKDGKYTLMAQGQQKEADAKEKEEMNEDAALIPELYMLKQQGYQYTVKGIEPVEGKDAYALAVKTPAGREFTNYYDVQSGVLVKKTSVLESPQGSLTVSAVLSNYKPFNGVQFPTKVVNDMGMMQFEIIFNDVKVNTGLKAEDIK